MRRNPKGPGTLLIIGGAEDKKEKKEILHAIAKHTGAGKLCVISAASKIGDELWETYRSIFRSLGVQHLSHLRSAQNPKQALRAMEGANTVFMTGGDQLKLTSELGGSCAADRIMEIFAEGGMIAGTSAGASAMSETMLVGGPGESSSRVNAELRMAPGFGLIKNTVIDQHFAERGRMARLVAAISRNPRYIGMGIDENTAILVKGERGLQVLGTGSVYILDAHEKTASNVSDATDGCSLSIFNMKLHVLCSGDTFDLKARVPGNEHERQVRAG